MRPMRVAAICLAVGLVLADSSVAVLALPAIYVSSKSTSAICTGC